ncbi:MAG: TatD family hydrolase [Puniceicoccales bacterium]|jgi:TatD DNase family protein|nr:TatD family hydrolase [Puniceicoccales bacterium]
MVFFDAHNHLQDERLDALVPAAQAAGIRRVVVNGTGAHDWPQVAALARRYPDWVLPAFGLHPWQIARQGADWLHTLREFLTAFPEAPVGEIGLHRWKPDAADDGTGAVALDAQIPVLEAQWALARELGRPVVLHCVRAFGALETNLRTFAPLPRGFLLHDYGGSVEQMKIFAGMGGWFSCRGRYLDDAHAARRRVFQSVPLEKLLLETDGTDADAVLGLPSLYGVVAQLRETAPEVFSRKIAENFERFFGRNAKVSDDA